MTDKKFDPKKLKKLNDPDRLKDIPPAYLLDKIDTTKTETFVEIGAGTAFFSIALLEHAKPKRIYACDISDVMLEWIKKNVVPNFPGIVPLKTAEHSIPLEDSMADLVFMINLHHELENPKLTLKEAYRILRPCGNVLVVDWKKMEMDQGPPIDIRYIPEDVASQLTGCGFIDVKVFDDLPKHFVVAGKKVAAQIDPFE